MHKIDDQLAKVTARIHQAATAVGRNPQTVQLIAVSKTQPAQALAEAYAWGQRAFGENYLQEALDKQVQLASLAGIEWHFIGPIQSNKTRPIAEHFDWVHSVDRLKIAQRLHDQRPEALPPLNICVQVNIDDETTKSGVSLDELPALVAAIAPLKRLTLRGLMAIPAATNNTDQQRAAFARLHRALVQLNQQGYGLDCLSMGMSGDLEAAIAEGATFVRVGTDIFGARATPAAG
jgi:pyridoxal phosphate enzyme (YggS family)